ncbi:GNAT family N-acetyltransferase [Nostoc sp. TCL26-01]|uniref:GNAT family N-acetyltransferase n=1 Tax=Nostoc sp. TCL26-01 TaxID=2576904 RepID=UPI0015C0D140|nr:GNAT family N-acetyltransferase [Nostoc sp. TCL26-01]QLE58326.1 GNAT family N-acetyltransferase [Nostoc sp. TCL26-01]
MTTNQPEIHFQDTREIEQDSIINLYKANQWSSSEKPDLLYQALMNSHSLISAWHEDKLVGLGNAISDGFLVVYYPHLLVLPNYQRQGIGSGIIQRLISRYQGFHQHILIADSDAIYFYKRCGFQRAGKTEPMWIYAANDH